MCIRELPAHSVEKYWAQLCMVTNGEMDCRDVEIAQAIIRLIA
jgi:hypothetical protein